jgi:nicotinate (nicotinamide) nucleotide adenylyltransferase
MTSTFKIVYTVNNISWPQETKISERKPFNIAILDSSFNPPTLAHKELLIRTSIEYSADAYLLLFSIKNADKQLTGANVEQRLKMMELLAETVQKQYSIPNVAVAVTEQARFFEKADEIHAWYKSNYPGQEVQLAFIMGYDTVIRLVDQKYYQKPVAEALKPFFEHNMVICADRGGHSEMEVDRFWRSNPLVQKFNKQIRRINLDDNLASISSTQVRNQSKEDMKQLVDENIQQYIESHSLYR